MANVAETLALFDSLKPGDKVEMDHEVKVGLQRWRAKTAGVVVETLRRRHGLHFQRNPDDRVYSDLIILRKPDGELTTVTIDEYSVLTKVS